MVSTCASTTPGACRSIPTRRRPRRPGHRSLRARRSDRRRGVQTPLLLRFDGILRARVRDIAGAFDRARAEFEYRGAYRGVFPIKVNQERSSRRSWTRAGATAWGSRWAASPSSIAGIAVEAGEKALMICNGYKDREYVETALLSSKPGHHPDHRRREVHRARDGPRSVARARDPPAIGVRTKLSFRSSGPLAGLGRRPLEVRPDHAPDRARRRDLEAAGHARLPRAPPLPHRQPDHPHPLDQAGDARGHQHPRGLAISAR